MMGVGKTTLGKRLARALHYTFVDLDKEIEEAEGKTVEQLFEQQGEAYFREKEHECLLQTQQRNHIVVATGGGTPAFANNMDWMNEHGRTVYLKASAAFILSRVVQYPNKRPLLKGKSPDEMADFISNLLTVRKPLYEQAFIAVEMPCGNLRELVKMLV